MKTSLLFAVCVGAICLPGSDAFAEEYIPKIIPQCLRYETTAGKEVCGYDSIDKVQQAYLADAELVAFRAKAPLIEAKARLLESQVADLRLAVDAQERATNIVKQRNRELTDQLIETDRQYQLERVKPRWGNPLAWTIAAAATAALGATLLVSVVD